MTTIRPAARPAALLLLALALPSAACAAPARHQRSATSTVTVDVANGQIRMTQHVERLVPYVLYDAEGHHARLATVTLEIRTRTDAEGVDPDSRVTVAVDDLDRPTARRLATFSANGSESALVGGRYVDVVQVGCCAGPDRHRVFDAESGRALFAATGAARLGTTAWAEIPNTRPALVRWAAVDGSVPRDPAANGRVPLARVAYGSSAGALSTVRVYARTPADAAALEMPIQNEAQLVWLGGKPDHDGASGEPDAPQMLLALDRVSDPQKIGGVQLALVVGGRRLAVLPVVADRLSVGGASVAHDIVLEAE